VLWSSDVDDFGETFVSWPFEQRIGHLQGRQRDEQLRELRLYRLARQAVPWKKEDIGHPPAGKLNFLAKIVTDKVYGTWTTFMQFSKSWAFRHTEQLEKHLPRIEEAGEADSSEEDDHKAEDLVGAKDSLNEKLSVMLSKLEGNEGTGQTKLMEAFGDLASYISQAIDHSVEATNGIKSEMNAVLQKQGRQRLLLFIMLGLIIWLILKSW